MSRPRLDRTNSSLPAREVLKQDYAVVPEVSSTVDLEKYISYARSAFYDAAKLYQKGDLKRAYVDFEKFQKFANEQLPNHADYDTERGAIFHTWLEEALESASSHVDEIEYLLDVAEDSKNPDGFAAMDKDGVNADGDMGGDEMEGGEMKMEFEVPRWIDGSNPLDSEEKQQQQKQEQQQQEQQQMQQQEEE
ncbi:hypothetical protein B484DRAFT_400827, partial [Ochromonadaceae sp. CCMP2298]